MELSEIYGKLKFSRDNKPKISFEIFPPKNGDISKLFEELRILKRYKPELVSLTFGANGGFNRFSLADLKSFQDLELNLMPHFTCVSMIRDEIEKYILSVENLGIENILALRGDIPDYINSSELDFRHACELVEFIKNKTTLSIAVAGYPEGHIESKTLIEDIQHLKFKINNGASAIFTQLFFENDKFYKYLDILDKNNIKLPVIAGIMPIRNLTQIRKMTSIARVTIPKALLEKLEKYPQDTLDIGTEYAISQCQDLITNGVDGLHFFTLNHSDQTSKILDNIL